MLPILFIYLFFLNDLQEDVFEELKLILARKRLIDNDGILGLLGSFSLQYKRPNFNMLPIEKH